MDELEKCFFCNGNKPNTQIRELIYILDRKEFKIKAHRKCKIKFRTIPMAVTTIGIVSGIVFLEKGFTATGMLMMIVGASVFFYSINRLRRY